MGEMERGKKFILAVFLVAILLAIFGVWYDVANAAPSYPPQVNRAINDLLVLTGANPLDVHVISATSSWRGGIMTCRGRKIRFGASDYKVTLETSGVYFYYTSNDIRALLCHVNYGRVIAHG